MFTALLLVVAAYPSELALQGFDPVALCQGEQRAGRADLAVTHGRFDYRFADEAGRTAFLAEPERWCIQWGGACARMGPLSGNGSPERWTVHDGRIYIFASDGCREGFLSAPERFVAKPIEAAAPSDEARRAAHQWLERSLAAHGGGPAVERTRGLRFVFEAERDDGWTQRLEQVVMARGQLMRRSTWTPPEEGEQSYDTTWWLDAAPGVDDNGESFAVTSPAQLDDLRRFVLREPLTYLWQRADSAFSARYAGRGELDGKPVENVHVEHHGLATMLHLDPESARIEGLSWRGRAGGGVTSEVVELFTDWTSVAGVQLPSGRRALVDGEQRASLAPAWTTIEDIDALPPRHR